MKTLTDTQQLYKLLEYFSYDEQYGSMLYANINAHDPSLTVCPECGVDDFIHIEKCWLGNIDIKNIELISPYQRNKVK